MTMFPSDNSNRTYEALSNALVQRTVFATGAVGMSGLPMTHCGEAVFVGRIRPPGKTQHFNFFPINNKPGRGKEIRYSDVLPGKKDHDSFYIVDIPGVGLAKVQDKGKQEWADFMREYLMSQKKVWVVFHLVDAQHGPIDE
eukprot:12390185-Ditylum_brightwellii.AAC.1